MHTFPKRGMSQNPGTGLFARQNCGNDDSHGELGEEGGNIQAPIGGGGQNIHKYIFSKKGHVSKIKGHVMGRNQSPCGNARSASKRINSISKTFETWASL